MLAPPNLPAERASALKVLVADPDEDLLDLVAYAFVRHGHEVVVAQTGAQALQRWQIDQPDLFILAALLPGGDGIDLCRRIRQSSAAPVIVIGTRVLEDDLIRAYENGADDFIAKPFGIRALLLRVQALARRTGGDKVLHDAFWEQRIVLGDLEIEPRTCSVSKDAHPILLTRVEFHVLWLLTRYAGSLVEFRRLLEYAHVKHDDNAAGALKTHISRIRHKLADAGGTPLLIRAIPRAGYILTASAVGQGALYRV